MELKIFNTSHNYTNQAYMNWRFFDKSIESTLDTMCKPYYEASIYLIETSIANNHDKKADGLIFPILFTFNHYMELRLKSVIAYFTKLEPDNEQIKKSLFEGKELRRYPKGHQIDQQLYILIKIVKSTKLPMIETHEKRFKHSKSYISQLKEQNIFNESPNLEFSRFPEDIKNNPFFYTASSENITIYLDNFKKIIVEISNELDNLYHQLTHIDEMMQDAHQAKLEYIDELRSMQDYY